MSLFARRRTFDEQRADSQQVDAQQADAQHRSQHTDTRARQFDDLVRDLRFAWRVLRRAPGFALSIVATLALGIAVATSVLSVAYEILLRPLPVREQSRVVTLWGDNTTHAPQHLPMSQRDLPAFARDSKTVNGLAGYEFNGASPQFIQFGDTAATVDNALVTGGYFDVLGVRPIVGRLLRPDDDAPGAAPVVVLGESFWRRALGADPAIVGRRVQIVGKTATVAGIAPRGFNLPGTAEMWLPLTAYAQMAGADSGDFALDLVGRLRPGASIGQTAAEFGAFLQRPDPAHMELERRLVKSLRPAVTPIADVIVGNVRPIILVVTGAALLLLVVTCVSAANLLIVRALARERELAVRLTLGAGRWRIGRQLVAESAIVTIASVAIGLSLAIGALKLFARYAPDSLPRFDAIGVDLRVLFVIAACCGLVTIGVSLLPAISGVGRDAAEILRGRGTGERRGAAFARRVLVTSQVAVSVCALVGAGLFLRSFLALGHLSLGFNPERVIFARVAVSPANVKTTQQIQASVDEIVRRTRELPGVQSATPAMSRPFAGAGGWEFPYALPGDTPSARQGRALLNVYLAGPGYFETMGTRLVVGRTFTDRDDARSPGVVIIDASVARAVWPGESAIGKRMGIGRESGDLQTVVGVVESTRYRDLLTPRPTAYMPFAQFTRFPPAFIAVRVRGDPAPVELALRAVVKRVDAGVFLPLITSMDQLVAEPLATPKLNSILLIAFAISIALLAAIGLYGLLAASVRTRRFELAVRLALGAESRAVAALVLRQGLDVFLVGSAIGLVAAVAGARLLRSVVFGVSPSDPVTIVAALAIVALVVAAASWLPARRAARVSPSDALRSG